MQKFGLSQSNRRAEDPRLLTGGGSYVDDRAPAESLRAFVLRSPAAHADLTLDVSAAEGMEGVRLILTADRLAEAGLMDDIPTTPAKSPNDGRRGTTPKRPLLATARVRHVGEPVAMVIADTLDQARDAAEAIEMDLDERPVKLDLAPGGEAVHPEAPDNVAYVWEMGEEAAVEAALEAAHRVVDLTVEDNRIIVASLEPRGVWAEPYEGDRLHVCVNGQGVWGTRDKLAKILGRSKDSLRVTNPDVGGGFGMKAMDYPETFLVAHAATVLGRPVRWMGDRSEAMLSDNAGRDLTCRARLGFDADDRLVAYHSENWANMGAYNSQYAQNIQSELFSKVLPGIYDVQATFLRSTGIYTHTTQVDAYRGAGRPEAIYLLERAMDHAAHELGVDPFDLRRKSLIPADKFPYVSATGETYDVGDFARVMDRARAEADVDGFAARRAEAEAAGRIRGLGVCYYIESILGSPEETAEIEFTDDGGAILYVGTQTNGQGHETVYRQFLATDLGLPPEKVEVVQGDSDRIAKGGGTGGSRSVTTQGTANKGAARKVIERFTPFVAEHLEEDEVTFEDGQFAAPATNKRMTVLEAAEAARRAGRTDLLRTSATTELPGRSYPNGCHICEVEIDRETGNLSVERYTVVDDFGVLMNPMMAEGQVHGGVVQGIGQAVSEHVVYDADGQLLTASFMDYGMPRAANMPMIAFHSEPVPSTANELGMKGCGEAGTVGAMAAVANAAADAMRQVGVTKVDMPFTPSRVWAYLQDAPVAAE
ncbi:xanthine dehydrogenase family protein [Jannaschia sp. Os4]|uniref:xanthine dehydrogenase family protein molybdopterin-binding subunit n=1 Tax=Jannaschia sp. Os4 TaxID=2807617 RepID=UPI00193A873E|nr:xanthine dehydrogenase family protein molybdopterin-binding subunit [Jannaschia sp. Os4]MBM2576916.1 xanthine dehydrogenase family protein [Jannaschia sp. Os4]